MNHIKRLILDQYIIISMLSGDDILESLGLNRRDTDKSIPQDIIDSLETGLFNIDNIKEEIDVRMDRVDNKLEEVEQIEKKVNNKINLIEKKIAIVELKVSGAVIMGLLYISDHYTRLGDPVKSDVAFGLAILFILQTLITVYRGFVHDFFLEWFVLL
jgi:hypothetical protein